MAWARFLGWILIIYFFIRLLIFIGRQWVLRSNKPNISAIKDQQLSILQARWNTLSQKRRGLDDVFSSIPEYQRLLINANVLSLRVGGYLGPFFSGVYDEDGAVRIALSTGARCLVLEVDYENKTYDPVLVYRDGWGMKQSLNSGDLNKVAKSIAGRAFTPANDSVPSSIAKDPLIIVLYFVRTPNQGKEPREYMRFLGAVAEKLQPLKDYLVGQTPQGDFRRQALESQLFFTNYQTFQNKIILLTNADTSGFRRLQALGLSGEMGIQQDLDFMCHARLYGRESPSQFGITGSPTSNIKPATVITSSQYWRVMPSDREKDAIEQTKQAWTLSMEPISSETNQIQKEDLKRFIDQYGVHSIPTSLFAKEQDTELFVGKGGQFELTAWTVKPELLRYIPARPIPIQKPYPQSNSGGGTVIAPKL